MTMDFENQYFDQLRAIEQAIHAFATQSQSLVDFQVDKVLSALEQHYSAEARGKNPPRTKLKATETQLFDSVKQALDVYLGRDDDIAVGEKQITLEEAIACIRRIRRSINQMRDKGRTAYLDFIASFFAG